MKVLFVSSGNSGKIGFLVSSQMESLLKQGIEVESFLIQGKGFFGYLKNIPKLRKFYKKGKFNLIHAHYSYCGIVAALSGFFPVIVSLMGSDAYTSKFWKIIIQIFYCFRWKTTIVKTEKMKMVLGLKKAIVLPNGVDIELFKPFSKHEARDFLKLNQNSKIVIFVSNPNRYEKNYNLAIEVCQYADQNIELIAVFEIDHKILPYYMNACNALILTSLWEGSVNVVKEAMACNTPIVSTDVGDVMYNLQGLEGCFVCNFSVIELSEAIQKAINFDKTTARDKLIQLELDSLSVANKLIFLYQKTIQND